jgi:SAM-dependent methyltransferase
MGESTPEKGGRVRYSFQRYLAAKQSIDDRCLNRTVLEGLGAVLPAGYEQQRLRVLELGSGIGTMLTRLIERRLVSGGIYTAVDSDRRNLTETRRHLAAWAHQHGGKIRAGNKTALQLASGNVCLDVRLHRAEALEYCNRPELNQAYDLVIASAFMDLVDIHTLLPRLCRLLGTNGLLYLALNFDGETVILPEIDPDQDRCILETYHESMDRTTAAGRPVGGRYTGRKLLALLRQAETDILAAGSSDWIVWPGADGYTRDEAYFLHFIMHTIDLELRGNPAIAGDVLEKWIRRRHRQIARGEMTFIAKQLDCLARIPTAGLRSE